MEIAWPQIMWTSCVMQEIILFNNWAPVVIIDPNLNTFSALSQYPLNYTPYRNHSNKVLSPFQSSNFQTPQL